MQQVLSNPNISESITISTFTITSTGPSGTVNVSTDVSSLKRGSSVILNFTGGSAGGFVNNKEYYIIPVTSGSFRVSNTREDAVQGNYISGASGNAGGGTVYPNYRVGGVLFVGTGGDVNMRGYENRNTGLSSFSLHKNVADGTAWPFMVKDVCASGTTATDLVAWYNV